MPRKDKGPGMSQEAKRESHQDGLGGKDTYTAKLDYVSFIPGVPPKRTSSPAYPLASHFHAHIDTLNK